MGTKRILIIDDDEDFCKIAKTNLELIGDFAVITAMNGKEGIKLADTASPDLILLDLLMPGMDGFEVLNRLKKKESTMAIPIVMLTAKGDEEFKIKASQLYDEGYITKPVEASALKSKIEEVLKRRGVK